MNLAYWIRLYEDKRIRTLKQNFSAGHDEREDLTS